MDAMKILAIVLIVAGVLGLMYGGFSYISDTHTTNLGLFKLVIQDKKWVNIPIWAGVGAIAAGSALLLFGARKS